MKKNLLLILLLSSLYYSGLNAYEFESAPEKVKLHELPGYIDHARSILGKSIKVTSQNDTWFIIAGRRKLIIPYDTKVGITKNCFCTITGKDLNHFIELVLNEKYHLLNTDHHRELHRSSEFVELGRMNTFIENNKKLLTCLNKNDLKIENINCYREFKEITDEEYVSLAPRK